MNSIEVIVPKNPDGIVDNYRVTVNGRVAVASLVKVPELFRNLPAVHLSGSQAP